MSASDERAVSPVTEEGPDQPGKIVVAGDWHGNSAWAESVIRKAGKLLADETERVIIHCGDFGIWPGDSGAEYIERVETACAENNVMILFAEGNHEWFDEIGKFDPWQSRYRWITHLPRGYRWTWHGRKWLALGGAVSVDRAVRTEGKDWWPEEEITQAEVDWVLSGGPADVMVTHECPAKVVHTFPPPPSSWDPRDIARSDRHRERLQDVVDQVQPRWLMHGHLHRGYQRVCDFGYGDVEVTGLDCDGGKDVNWAVLDVKAMRWGEAG